MNGISALKKLEYLSLVGNKNLTNYEEIGSLSTLNNLDIEGPMAGVYKLGSLAFLTQLDLLRLSLQNVSVNKNQLTIIANLRNLQKLGLAIHFKVEDIAFLKGALPQTDCYDFKPYHTDLDKYDNLKKCSTCAAEKVKLTGKVKPQVICPNCERELLDAHVKLYELWTQKGQQYAAQR